MIWVPLRGDSHIIAGALQCSGGSKSQLLLHLGLTGFHTGNTCLLFGIAAHDDKAAVMIPGTSACLYEGDHRVRRLHSHHQVATRDVNALLCHGCCHHDIEMSLPEVSQDPYFSNNQGEKG